MAIDVGLGLDLSEMEEVLRQVTPSRTCKYLFTAFYQQGIDVCNAFLSEMVLHFLEPNKGFSDIQRMRPRHQKSDEGVLC